MSNYRDINTGKEYSYIPVGKVIPLIVNGQPVTETAYNNYMSQHPIQLGEIVIEPTPEVNPTETEQNLKYRRKVQEADARTAETSAFHKPINFLSPSQYVGAAFNYFQGESPFWMGVYNGNSGYLPDNFAKEYPRATSVLNMLGDAAIGYGTSKVYNWGTKPRFAYGTETPLVEYTHFSPKVTKHTTVTPVEMHIRNNTPGFVKSTYKGVDSSGLYVYTQPKMWFPRNPRVAFNSVVNSAIKNGYKIVTHPNLQGTALINKRLNRVISDFGENGYGQVGWTWKGPGFGDAAFETIPEFKLAMEKKGGKLNGKV